MAEPVDPREDRKKFFRALVGGLIQTAVERRSELIVSSSAVAVTNVVHWAWNAAAQAQNAHYWALYVENLHRCMGQ